MMGNKKRKILGVALNWGQWWWIKDKSPVYSNHYSTFCNSKCIFKFIGNFISENIEHVYCDNYEIQTSKLNIDNSR